METNENLTTAPSLVAAPNNGGGAPAPRFLSRAEILSADDRAFEDVYVPEWGADAWVRVRGLTGRERDAFEGHVAGGEKLNFDNVRARLLALTIVDEESRPLFAESDIPLLGMKSAAALSRVYNVAAQLSGLTKQDVEALAKNSGGARRGASSSR